MPTNAAPRGIRGRARAARALAARALAALLATGAAAPARAAGPPIVVAADPGADAGAVRRVRAVVAARRAVRDEPPLPAAQSVSPRRAALDARRGAIAIALERARQRESEAAWDECVREGAFALGDAIAVLAEAGDLALLRDLHRQIGVCTSLGPNPANARPHFLSAALLDEAPPPAGIHREEAEKAEADARAEVLGRTRGKIRIETEPPGAEIWIDGRKVPGTTPLEAEVRLGDHFVTARRFRFEPHTERRVLQPSGMVRVALDPARRDTLREQLAAAAAAPPPAGELRLARAVWARAEQVLVVRADGGRVGLRLLDAVTGKALRAATFAPADEETAVQGAVCSALGETCAPPSGGIPWYVWPLAGAVVASGVVVASIVAVNERDVRFCPSAGCR